MIQQFGETCTIGGRLGAEALPEPPFSVEPAWPVDRRKFRLKGRTDNLAREALHRGRDFVLERAK